MWPFKKEKRSLSHAVLACDVRAVRRLLKAGSDPNARDPGDTAGPINYSVNSTPEIVQLLIDHGADVNVSARGSTPLAMAEARGKHEIAAILRSAGAQVRGSEDDLSIDPRLRIQLWEPISQLVLLARINFPTASPEVIADKVQSKLNVVLPPNASQQQRETLNADVRTLIMREINGS